MPWKESGPVDERMRFIGGVLEDPKGNFRRLCESFGISRAQGYKWLNRYKQGGPAALEDRRPVALSCPHKTPDEVADRIVRLRKEHPFDGPKKLRVRLQTLEPTLAVPAASTIGDILDRHGLIRPRRARLRVPPHPSPLEPCAEPNDVWCVDFKGNFVCGSTRCYPLTLTDGASRYLIKCEGLLEPKFAPVRHQFELAFREFGLPARLRSDNGPPFASKAIGGLSALSVWCIQLGVMPERIEPGHPEQNGRHERMHRTLKQHTANPPASCVEDQQRAFDRFRADYNDHRPHEALGMTPPASHYEPSLRAMPSAPKAPEYAPELHVRNVAPNGHFSWKGTHLRLGKLLASQPVGLKPLDEDEWELFYGPLLIGYVLIRDRKARIEPIS